jgi:hypothetical protein
MSGGGKPSTMSWRGSTMLSTSWSRSSSSVSSRGPSSPPAPFASRRDATSVIELLAYAAPGREELRAELEVARRDVRLVVAALEADAVALDRLKGEPVGHVDLLVIRWYPSARAEMYGSPPAWCWTAV